MASKFRTIPPARMPVKVLKRNTSTTSLANLVRDNVITLTRDYMARDKALNQELREFNSWRTKGSKPANKYSDEQIAVLEARRLVDPKDWTQSRLAKTLGIRVTVIRRLFAKDGPKASRKLTLDDVVAIAAALHVSPSYLLQPNNRQLENDSILQIHGLQKTSFTVGAHTWFYWVNGLAGLDARTNDWYIKRMAELTTIEDATYEEPSNLSPNIELSRIMREAYTSPYSSGVAAFDSFNPEEINLSGPSYIGQPKRLVQPADRERRVFQAVNESFTAFRLGLAHMFKHETTEVTEKAIRWSLGNIGRALATMASNRASKLK